MYTNDRKNELQMQNEVSQQKNRRDAKSLSKIRDDTKMTKTDNNNK